MRLWQRQTHPWIWLIVVLVVAVALALLIQGDPANLAVN
jgi:hypothetical protein